VAGQGIERVNACQYVNQTITPLSTLELTQ